MPKRVTAIRIKPRNLRAEVEREFFEAKMQGVKR
jgi:hypothetical protein